MSDDSFIREVDEELRADRARDLWSRYGKLLIAAALLVVLATAAWRGWEWWVERQASTSGDRFLAALQLSNDGKADEAIAALEALQKDGYGAYPVLAAMRAATELQKKGDTAGAVAAFDKVANDAANPQPIAQMAKLRAGYILVDTGAYADVSARVETLAVDGNPLRHAAREALGLAAYKEGRLKDAEALFRQIADDGDAPRGVRERAGVMIDLIVAAGVGETAGS
ncbi:MAG TPA: tetratricopeptide repeat protein [Rhizobiaceae bacterium]|nr:tetratricopeptide repeat protein [Rhizobiaceae bacterium]